MTIPRPEHARITGSCLCQGVRFTVAMSDIDRERMAHCHCTDCRKFHGAAFSTLCEARDLQWERGADLLTEFTTPHGSVRQFCSACGSSLTFRSAGSDTIEFALAALDSPTEGLVPDAHVFYDSRMPWVDSGHDGLPKYSLRRGSRLVD